MRKRRVASSSLFVFFKYNLLHRSAKLANPVDRFDHESNFASGSPFLDSRPLSILILQLLCNLRPRDQKFLKREQMEQMRLDSRQKKKKKKLSVLGNPFFTFALVIIYFTLLMQKREIKDLYDCRRRLSITIINNDC